MTEKHECDELCICPIHKTSLWYAPASNEHACQNPSCEYANGIKLDIFEFYRNFRD